jgi:hypothetical protein
MKWFMTSHNEDSSGFYISEVVITIAYMVGGKSDWKYVKNICGDQSVSTNKRTIFTGIFHLIWLLHVSAIRHLPGTQNQIA